MKIGEIIEVDGVKYIAQNDNRCGCDGCSFLSEEIVCHNVRKFECNEHGSIMIKVPIELIEKIEQLEKQIELMKNCDNCGIENISRCMELDCKDYDKWEAKE